MLVRDIQPGQILDLHLVGSVPHRVAVTACRTVKPQAHWNPEAQTWVPGHLCTHPWPIELDLADATRRWSTDAMDPDHEIRAELVADPSHFPDRSPL